MRGSVRIGRIGGVPLRVHWTFPLLVLLVVAAYGSQGLRAVGTGLLWLAAVFASVTIHELTHSLVARHRGLVVRDIVLLPIGGVSEIAGIQSSPSDELVIAAVGPMSNFVIAGSLAVLGVLLGQTMWPPTLFAGSWVSRLLWMNVLLGAFNLVPSLPLDGGRVLQGYLAKRRGEPAATLLAVRIARVLAAIMVVGGLFVNLWITIIGVFVFLASAGELQVVLQRARLASWRVRELMVHEPAVQEDRTVADVRADYLLSYYRALPVLHGSRYAGIVSAEELGKALPSAPVAAVADRHAPLLDEEMTLFPVALAAFDRSGRRELAVGRGALVTGVLHLADIERLLQRAGPPVGAASRGPWS